MRVVILGAGFGGLELSTALSDELGDTVDVVLIDRAEGFIFGFSKLDVMFGRAEPDAVFHPYDSFTHAGVRFVQAEVVSIEPANRRVVTDAGSFDGDVLVVALGADLDPASTPGLVEAGCEFYTPQGALAARDLLAGFAGGRVIVGVTSTPFKCPPAPSEAALLLHDYLTAKGVRDRSSISLVMPMPMPIPPSPEASSSLLDAFAQRGIEWCPNQVIEGLDSARRVAQLADGAAMPFDLFLGVPRHRAPSVVVESGLTTDGWIPVDPRTLETTHDGVYALGDVTSVGTPKAGVFSERQAAVVAARIIEMAHGADATSTYDGHGMCYLEFGHDEVARVTVTFSPGEAPRGTYDAPSALLASEKGEFGTSRIRRWFDREWSPL